MEQIECSETSAYKIQTPENHPEENIQQTETSFVFKQRNYTQADVSRITVDCGQLVARNKPIQGDLSPSSVNENPSSQRRSGFSSRAGGVRFMAKWR
jgi:hypothetical protein